MRSLRVSQFKDLRLACGVCFLRQMELLLLVEGNACKMLGTVQHTKELNQCWQVLSKTPPRSLPDLVTDEPNQVSPYQSNQTSGTSRTAHGFFSWQQSTVFSVPSHQPSLSLKTPGRYHLTLPALEACSLGIFSLSGSQLLDRYKQRSRLLAQDPVRGLECLPEESALRPPGFQSRAGSGGSRFLPSPQMAHCWASRFLLYSLHPPLGGQLAPQGTHFASLGHCCFSST